EEFLAGLDATVVRGRCLSYGQGITYFPVVEVVKSLQRLDPGGEVARLLEQDPAVGAGLDALMGVVEAATSSSEIAWAVRKVLEAGAASGPLVVVIDDVHWGEPTLFDLIEHVTDLSRGAPLLLLCMARPELLDRRPGWGAGALNATSVLLEPLDEQETDSLMDSLLLSGGHLDDRLRQRVRTAAGGNPLFLEEMLALAVTSGGGDGSDLVVPPTIQALLAARLDQLQPTERRILERGSVEGQSFHRGAVRALTPEEPEIQARLVGLVRKDLVRPDRATLPGEDAFRFRHLLIRDAAYDGLSKSTRAELHERFAEWLEHTAGELVELDEILGYHLEQAVRYRSELGPLDDAARELAGRAARRLEAAGLRALDRGDNSAAMNLLERALDLLPAEELYVDLELEIVRAMCSVGRLEEAVDRAQGVARKAEAAGDPVGALEAWLVRACWLIQTDPQAGGPELEARVALARTAFAEVTDDVVLAYFWWAVAHIEHIACRFGAGFEAAVRALDHADKAGLRSFAADCRVMAAAAAAHGPLPAVAAIEWLSHAQQSMPYYHAWIELMRCMSLALIGELEEARAAYAQAFGAMVERGDQTGAALSRMSRWHIEAAAGNHAEAATVARQGCEELEQLGERGWLSTLACQLAQSLYLLGRYQEAEEWATRGAELGSEDDIATQALARQVLAKLAARRGEHDKARSMALEALALTESTESPVHRGDVLLDLAEVHHLCGEQAEAARMAQQAIEAYDRKGATALVHQVEQRLAEFVASS
ncbi:MAG TPA: hypothetical protein VEJ44_07480, partial [Acidimicrobiales bacterium]|nr:hypothetical protein [Acidimicrobiales bacterium]